jgi:hypothetical protein
MRLNDEISLSLPFRHSNFVIVSTFDIRHSTLFRRPRRRTLEYYPPGFADGAGPGGLFCGAPCGGIVPGVGPVAGWPGA